MPEEKDLRDMLSDARERRDKGGNDTFETDIPYSEYNKIIMLCHSFFQAYIESYQGQPMMIRRRNRLFQTIETISRHRKGLPSPREHFGDRKMGVFKGTIAEVEALEYVNIIQTKVMEMNDPKVDVGTLDDDLGMGDEIE